MWYGDINRRNEGDTFTAKRLDRTGRGMEFLICEFLIGEKIDFNGNPLRITRRNQYTGYWTGMGSPLEHSEEMVLASIHYL